MKKILLSIALICFCLAGALMGVGCGGNPPKECLFLVQDTLPEHVSVECSSGVNNKDGCIEGGTIHFTISFEEGYDMGSIVVKNGTNELTYKEKYGEVQNSISYSYELTNVTENVLLNLTGEAELGSVSLSISLSDSVYELAESEDLQFWSESKITITPVLGGETGEKQEFEMTSSGLQDAFTAIRAVDFKYGDKVIIGMYHDSDTLTYIHENINYGAFSYSEETSYIKVEEKGSSERVVTYTQVTLKTNENLSIPLTSELSAKTSDLWFNYVDDEGEELFFSKGLECGLYYDGDISSTITELLDGARPVFNFGGTDTFIFEMLNTLSQQNKVKINGDKVVLQSQGDGTYKFINPSLGYLELPWEMTNPSKDYEVEITGLEEYLAQKDNYILIETVFPVWSYYPNNFTFLTREQVEHIVDEQTTIQKNIYKEYYTASSGTERRLEFYLDEETISQGGELQFSISPPENSAYPSYNVFVDLDDMYNQGSDWEYISLDECLTATYEGGFITFRYDTADIEVDTVFVLYFPTANL